MREDGVIQQEEREYQELLKKMRFLTNGGRWRGTSDILTGVTRSLHQKGAARKES